MGHYEYSQGTQRTHMGYPSAHSMRYRSRSDCPGSARALGRAGRWARPGFHKLQECMLCRIVHGAVVRACHMFAGLGEPCFDKLEAMLAHAMLSIPSTKGFVLGSGFEGTKMRGSGMQYNQLTPATSAPGPSASQSARLWSWSPLLRGSRT